MPSGTDHGTPPPLWRNVRSASGRGFASATQPPRGTTTADPGAEEPSGTWSTIVSSDALGRRPAQRLGGHIHDPLEVLVVDRLIHAGGLPPAQLGERT